MTQDQTAARLLPVDRSADGYRLLRDVGSSYRDGGEEFVLSVLRGAADLSSTSDELITHATTWAHRYHLDPARANVLRTIALPPDARVLEIGAGCGAISRYLGEQCAVVDALEPVPARAAAAAARCADLPGVEVFVGELDDLPPVPSYDVIVVIGVLEYVGAGTSDPEPYREFLRQIAERLVDGGTLVLAIENRLGVKYLVGSPEDHTNRVFDSIEGYPAGGKAHTFDRLALEALMADAGLTAHTLGAFPDYKMTRMVFDDRGGPGQSLLYRIPRFPSPDWLTKRPRLADERSVWQNLVTAGVAREFANSFVTLARKGDGRSLWPAERRIVFFAEGRTAPYSAVTHVEETDGALQLRRAPLRASGLVTASTEPYVPGVDLIEEIARVGVADAGPLLHRWLDLLDAELATDPAAAIDAVPHNVILADPPRVIDRELRIDRTRDQIIRRGIYLAAKEAAPLAPPSRWAPHTTVGELMVALGATVGLDAAGTWLDTHIADESALQVPIRRGRPVGVDDAAWAETIAAGMRGTIGKKFTDLPLGTRLPQRHADLGAKHKKATAELAELRAKHDKTVAALAAEKVLADKWRKAHPGRPRRRVLGIPVPRFVGRIVRKVLRPLRHTRGRA